MRAGAALSTALEHQTLHHINMNHQQKWEMISQLTSVMEPSSAGMRAALSAAISSWCSSVPLPSSSTRTNLRRGASVYVRTCSRGCDPVTCGCHVCRPAGRAWRKAAAHDIASTDPRGRSAARASSGRRASPAGARPAHHSWMVRRMAGCSRGGRSCLPCAPHQALTWPRLRSSSTRL